MMKKAIIEQMLLGFLVILGLVTFVATSADEFSTRNKLYDLKTIAMQTGKTMAKSYEQNMDMCFSKNIAKSILEESALGKELLSLENDKTLTLSYDFYDLQPEHDDGTKGDNQPDTVKVSINGYSYDTFWYKFFDKKSFSFGEIKEDFNVDTPTTVTIRYGGKPSASFQNIFGTYQLDTNNCVTNMKMHMANSKGNWNSGDLLADGFESPPTYVFAIANGNNHFNQPVDNAPIQLVGNHCFNTSSYPKLKINGVTKQATVGNAYTGNVFFQQQELNPDGFDHFHVIPASIMDKYIHFKNNIYSSSGNEKDRYEAFKQYADALNKDTDDNNDINYLTDPNNEYKYALEDLDAAQSDMDFTDMLLDGERLVIPNEIDKYTIDQSSRKVIFNDGYCEDEEKNTPPTLELKGCPITIAEDTPTSAITWIEKDTDGTIDSRIASTNNGSAAINGIGNGTITYTPDLNFYGEDIITVVIHDNDGGQALRTCKVTITEVNDNPTLTGTPITTAVVGQQYSFTVAGEDVDGDVITYSIQNIPSWATFVVAADKMSATLSGVPGDDDNGIYPNIIISASDGRGGNAQLSAFTITVTGGNEAPKLNSEIPDQTVQEEDTFSYNVAPHFSDPNGDALKYTLSATMDGNANNWLSITDNGQISSITIPNGYVGKVIVVTITASDGKKTKSDTFNLTITNKSNVPTFLHTFDFNNQGWSGRAYWEKYQNDGKLKITRPNNNKVGGASYRFNFGPEYANKDIELKFDFYYSGGWESSGNSKDYFAVRVGGDWKGWEDDYGNGSNGTYGAFEKTYSGRTDSNGRVLVELFINTSYVGEYALIDNVSVLLK